MALVMLELPTSCSSVNLSVLLTAAGGGGGIVTLNILELGTSCSSMEERAVDRC